MFLKIDTQMLQEYMTKYPHGKTIFESLSATITSFNDYVNEINTKTDAGLLALNAARTDITALFVSLQNELTFLTPQEISSLVNFSAEFDVVKSQLADTVTTLRLTEGVDCTAIIQAALNKKGWVRIVSPGTFLTGRLLIDDNTKFELLPGVNLKKKDGTNHYILVNRGHVEGYRNKNITLKGGSWLLNSVGNPNMGGDLSTNIQAWSGIGILLSKITNLIVEDIQGIGGEWKYCFLITDIDGGRFRNIEMDNESDGLHFQPPMKNIFIENISGVTHDDLISFTMGDYPRFSLGQLGNIENVVCRNVYARETTDQLIKLVGSGLDGNSIFKNMKFENLSGYATLSPVNILKEDQATANPCLMNTKLENIVFENIDVKVYNNLSYFNIGAASGDITIKKLKARQADTLRPITFTKANLSKVVIDDMHVIASAGTENTNYIIGVTNTAAEVIEQLILKDSNIKLNTSAAGYIFNMTNKGVKDIIVSNTKINAPGAMFIVLDGIDTDGKNVYITSSQIHTNYFGMIYNKINFFIVNSVITSLNKTFHLNDGADIRVKSRNSDLTVVINGVTALRKLSLSGDVKTSVLPSALTPVIWDKYFYDSVTDAKNKGEYFYNGVKWLKTFTLTETVTDIVAGTINAQSTKEFLIVVLDIGNYKSILANPQFILPDGIVYSVVHRQENGVRLRLANVTTAAITFNADTDKTWNLKIINDAYVV